MPIPRAASCETTSGPPGGWTAAPNTYIREEAKQSGPEKSVGRDSSEKMRGVCHVSLERNTRPATFHICKQQRTRGAVAKRRACTDPSCTRAKYFRLKRRRPLPEARSDSSAAALRGSDRDTAEGGAFTQTAPPQQCGCKPEGRSSEFRRRCHPLPREVGRDFRGGGRPSRQRWGRRHRVRRDTAADPADGGGEDLREAATGGSRRQAPCASCSTMDKHAYAQMRPVLSRRAQQRASTTQPATGRPETIPPVERARANCLPYSQRRSLENAPDIEGPGLQPWSKGGRCG